MKSPAVAAAEAGLHVLADKPMCIDLDGYQKLQKAFAAAERNGVLVYDIMTERSEITTILQRASVGPVLAGIALSLVNRHLLAADGDHIGVIRCAIYVHKHVCSAAPNVDKENTQVFLIISKNRL